MSYAALPNTPTLASDDCPGEDDRENLDKERRESALFDRRYETSPRKRAGNGPGLARDSLHRRDRESPYIPAEKAREYASIDWINEYNHERERRERLTSIHGVKGFLLTSWDISQVWLILLLTGLSVGLLASCLVITSTWLSDLRLGYCRSSIILSHSACCQGLERNEVCFEWRTWNAILPSNRILSYIISMMIYVITSTGMAAAASWQIAAYSPLAFHTGIPEIKAILGGFVFDQYLGSMILFIKSVSLAFASGSGLVLGKEGPLVHIACCIGSSFASVVSRIYPRSYEPPYLHNNAKKREILSAASAAGVSVAFGAPVGGVLFALEEISYYYPDRIMWHSFVCAMVAALTLQRIDPFHTGKLVLYQVTSQEAWRGFELVFFIFLGIAGGLCGAIFIHANIAYEHFRRRAPQFKDNATREVVFIALVTSVICFFIPYSRVSLSELVEHLLSGCEDSDWENLCGTQSNVLAIAFLLITAFIKYILAIATFGALVPAGIFLPSLAIGACVGRAIGISVEAMYQATKGTSIARIIFSSCPADGPCTTPAVYAVIGAASLMAGITRMTLSLVVILFELTGALTYVLPIMIAVMTSKWVGDSFTDSTSIYEAWIRLRGYPFLGGDVKQAEEPTELSAHDSRPSFHASRTNLVLAPELDDRQMTTQDTISAMMRPLSSLRVVTASDFSIADGQALLRAHGRYRGFPVIFEHANPMLVGYLSREALQSVIADAVVRGHDPSRWTLRFFSRHSRKTSYLLQNASRKDSLQTGHHRADSLEDLVNARIKTSRGDLTIDMRGQTNMTPLTLSPKFPISQTNILFKRMGPRYILVTQNGRLMGFFTRSDMWRRTHLDYS